MPPFRFLLIAIFLCLILTLGGSAQDIQYVSTALPWGNITSLTVSENYAYCSVSHLLLTFSLSDPTHPILVNSSPGFGGDGGILYGNYIYFASTNDNFGTQVVDISNPLNPTEVVNFDAPSQDIYADSSYLYIAASNQGFRIYDNSDPRNPAPISSIYTRQYAEGLDVVGHYAYIADYDAGLIPRTHLYMHIIMVVISEITDLWISRYPEITPMSPISSMGLEFSISPTRVRPIIIHLSISQPTPQK